MSEPLRVEMLGGGPVEVSISGPPLVQLELDQPQSLDVAILGPIPAQLELASGIAGPPGPVGPPGSDGEGSVTQWPAASALSALRVVCPDTVGRVRYADPLTPADAATVIGVTTTAASAAGDLVTVKHAGRIVDSAWNWSRGPVWLGAGGTLTQTAPTSGRVVRVGFGHGSELFVRIGEPIQLI